MGTWERCLSTKQENITSNVNRLCSPHLSAITHLRSSGAYLTVPAFASLRWRKRCTALVGLAAERWTGWVGKVQGGQGCVLQWCSGSRFRFHQESKKNQVIAGTGASHSWRFVPRRESARSEAPSGSPRMDNPALLMAYGSLLDTLRECHSF